MLEERDRMTLADVRVFARIGVTGEERAAAQECRVDLDLYGSLRAAADTAALARSIDYCRILDCVEETAAEREYRLVETLACALARRILRDFPVSRARVRLRKRPAELAGRLGYVEVEVEERRGDGRSA